MMWYTKISKIITAGTIFFFHIHIDQYLFQEEVEFSSIKKNVHEQPEVKKGTLWSKASSWHLGIIKSVKNTQNERGSKKKYIKIELRENIPTLFPNSLYSTN